jgi:hypothetical protein
MHLTRHATRLGAALVTSAALTVMISSPVSAHEERAVDQVNMVVGWVNEPAYTGFPNAVQLFLTDAAGEPIRDLGDTLKVDVSLGEESTGELALDPAFGEDFGTPGEYNAHLIPSRPGAYTFTFAGTVRGQTVDEAFTAAEEGHEGFSLVEDDSEVAFPVKDPSRAELAQKVDRVEPRIENASQELAAASNDVDDAKSQATIAIVLSAIAIIAAIGMGVVAMRRSG